MSQQAIEQQIEVTIKQLEDTIALSDAVKRLRDNADFKRIVVQGYFTDNAVRLVHVLASPAISHSEAATKAVHNEMQAIALFRDFLNQIDTAADRAEQALEANRHELEFVRSEVEGDE